MSHAVIAKNYAEALLAAAEAKNQAERFGDLLDAVAGAVRRTSGSRSCWSRPGSPRP